MTRGGAICVALLLSCVASAAPPLPAQEARRILAAPRSALSVGKTNEGRLVRGVEIPLRGPGWAFFDVVAQRGTNFAIPELSELLRGAAAAVRRRFPRAVLGLGNVSRKDGGPVGESVSHQSGRDADVGMFAIDRRGRRVELRAFVAFGEDGWTRNHRLRFDAQRNLALVHALIDRPGVPVQFIFVADWLKDRLLRQARREGLPDRTIARLDTVMNQPADSNPHAEHFHVRIYCPLEDRLHGCLERGPVWDWVDLGDAAYAARVRDLLRVAERPEAALRRQAIDALGALRSVAAIPRLVSALGDPVRAVRRAALEALRDIEEPSLVQLLVSAARKSPPAWAGRLLDAALSVDAPETASVARRLLSHPSGPAEANPRVRAAAATALGWWGGPPDAQLLVVLRTTGAATVQAAAQKALEVLTNQPLRTAEEWRSFLRQRPAGPWLEWMRLGLARRGLALRRLGWRHAERLVEHVRSLDRVGGWNAGRVLARLTGFDIDPRRRTPRNNQRLWRTFFRVLRAHFGAAEEVRRPRRAPG